jgi:hypothetical protein
MAFDPGTYNNTSIFSRSNKYFNRIDWNINDKNQLTLRNNTIIIYRYQLRARSAELPFWRYRLYIAQQLQLNRCRIENTFQQYLKQ